MIQDHSPVRLNSFMGLFGIDSYADSVPKDHFIDSHNTITEGGEIRTRDGFALSITFPAMSKIYYWRLQGQATRVIALNNTGQLYDLTVDTVNPILNIAAMTNFSAAPFNNRLYISPNNGVTGLPGEFVYVYTGSGAARKSSGNAPSTGFSVALSATAGHVESGTHILAWVFETTSGFVTPPGPAAFQIIVTDGTKKLDTTLVPVGPSGTAKRRLIGSRSIQDYNGNQNAYEMFFVPGGIIEDNLTTELLGIDFYDADLQLSADYTFDQFAEIPAVLFLSSYGRRMIYGATDADKNIVYISKDNEPESINSLAGFQSFDPHETEGVKDATEFRGNLYVMKRNKTYVGRDNTYEPSTWKFDTLDSSIGCDFGGIAKYIDAKGSKSDFFLAAGPSGFFKFTGIYEEVPLSYKIRNWWKRINSLYLNQLQVLLDAEKALIYILVPLDGAVSPNYILVAEYENGLNFDKLKWHIWSLQDFSPSSIAIDLDNTTKKTTFKLSSLSGNIYTQEIGRRNDNNTSILSHIKFALIHEVQNAIHHIGALGFRIKGSGTLNIEIRGQENIDVQTLPNLTLGATPGKEIIRQSFFQSEKASVKISMSSANGYFILRELTLYMNLIFMSRPA